MPLDAVSRPTYPNEVNALRPLLPRTNVSWSGNRVPSRSGSWETESPRKARLALAREEHRVVQWVQVTSRARNAQPLLQRAGGCHGLSMHKDRTAAVSGSEDVPERRDVPRDDQEHVGLNPATRASKSASSGRGAQPHRFGDPRKLGSVERRLPTGARVRPTGRRPAAERAPQAGVDVATEARPRTRGLNTVGSRSW